MSKACRKPGLQPARIGLMECGLNEATQTHCYNPVAPAYPVWAYYAHGRQRRCQEDPVSLPSGRLEKTTRSSPHHVAQHRPTGSETPPYAPRSSRFGSEQPSVEDDVDVWRYTQSYSCMPETTTIKCKDKIFVRLSLAVKSLSLFY